MERLEHVEARAHLARQGLLIRVICLVAFTLLLVPLGGCHGAAPPTEKPVPPYLRMSPCGGEAQVQWADASEWRVVEAPIALWKEAEITAQGVEGGRLCATDGSVLELAPGATVYLRPTEDESGLEISLREGTLLLLALEPVYKFDPPGCSVSGTDLPARISVKARGDETQLRVEKGRVTCVVGVDAVELETCWEIVTGPGMDTEIDEYCGRPLEPTPVEATSSPMPWPTPAEEPTATASPTASPSPTSTATATSTPLPTPTPRPFIPTSTPTPVPPTATPPPPPPPPPPPSTPLPPPPPTPIP